MIFITFIFYFHRKYRWSMGWRDYFNANMHLSGQQHAENRRRAFIVIYLFKEKHVHDVRNMLVKRNA